MILVLPLTLVALRGAPPLANHGHYERVFSSQLFFSGSSFFLSLPAMYGLHGWA
jgi:hypothetical protein